MILVLAFDPASAQDSFADCGSLENAFGPFDYTNPAYTTEQQGRGESPLGLVEGGHFDSDVENLVRGVSTSSPLNDLDYTLRAFPNHHRALHAIANYHLKYGLRKHGRYTIECWFDRAMRFRPDDPIVRVVYGVFLAKKGSSDDALEQYKEALQIRESIPEAHYNIGLLYTELRQYDLAYDHAIRAYELGYPLPGLRNRLIKAGVWDLSPKE